MKRLRAWFLKRAEHKLADLSHYYGEWVYGWRRSPSEVRFYEESIKDWIRVVRNRGGDPAEHLHWNASHLLEKVDA
jgi:hypothetical protein